MYDTNSTATKFNIIVEIISLTPAYTLNRAGNNIHSAPTVIPIKIQRVTWLKCPKLVNLYPAQPAYNAPTYIDPFIPMLNIPTRNEISVAVAVNIRGVA